MSWRLITYYLSLISGAISLVYALKNGWLERHKLEGIGTSKGILAADSHQNPFAV